jgi:hypothetical protein
MPDATLARLPFSANNSLDEADPLACRGLGQGLSRIWRGISKPFKSFQKSDGSLDQGLEVSAIETFIKEEQKLQRSLGPDHPDTRST